MAEVRTYRIFVCDTCAKRPGEDGDGRVIVDDMDCAWHGCDGHYHAITVEPVLDWTPLRGPAEVTE